MEYQLRFAKPYISDGGLSIDQMRQISAQVKWPLSVNSDLNITAEATALASKIAASGRTLTLTGHTKWFDGGVHQTGFTALLPPNSRTLHSENGKLFDVDYVSWSENKSSGNIDEPQFSITTARSFHPSVVICVCMDGSVLRISDKLNPFAWRARATRADGELFR